MPGKDKNKKGLEIPEGDDFLDVVDFYTKVWGLKPSEAVQQAQEDYARGPNSPIYKNRLSQAQDWKAREEDAQAKAATRPQLAQIPAATGAVVIPPPNPRNAQVASQYLPPSVNPESTMADIRYWDPKGYAAQQALNARRAALGETQAPQDVGPQEITSGPNPEQGMVFDPEAQKAQAALNLRRQQLNQAAPVSPLPLKSAAITPEHLEDANLSSWQSLAGLLGYSGYSPRR